MVAITQPQHQKEKAHMALPIEIGVLGFTIIHMDVIAIALESNRVARQ